jgi:chromosome segregation ATPase
LQGLVPAEVDAAMVKSCQVAQELMLEVVQSVMDNTVQLKAMMAKIEGATGDEEMKAQALKANKRVDDMAKNLDALQQTHREYVIKEGSQADEWRTAAARSTELDEQVNSLLRQVEQTERRLVLSEENVRAAKEASATNDVWASSGAKGADAGDAMQQRNQEYKHQAESRLEEIKALQKKILQMSEQNGAASHNTQEVSENMVQQSPAYIELSERFKALRKECDTYHAAKINQLNLELAQEREARQRERQAIEEQHKQNIQHVLKQRHQAENQVMEAKQEVRSLQFKLEQKSVGELATKHAEELNETLQKVQTEYTRLRKEHDAFKARPDAEELRREFREEKEKLWKERDTESNRAADLAEQLKEKEKKIEELMSVYKGDGANGVNGLESALQKEIAQCKKENEGLRSEKKDLQRRLAKADRGFNDCNKLYQQFRKEKEETMKDLESLGLSFEEMQEQNTRLLRSMKQKDEDHNELLRQRIRERQERDMLAEEKNALKNKLDKTEELLRAREEATERIKKDLENAQLEQAKRLKEEECSAAIVAEHRKMLQVREAQQKDARRDADKARASLAELTKVKQESEKELHEAKFERARLQEEFDAAQRRLSQLVSFSITLHPSGPLLLGRGGGGVCVCVCVCVCV